MRFLRMALLTALTLLALSTAGSVVASAAGPPWPAPAASPVNGSQGQTNNNQNGQGQNGQGQNGQGQGTKTPELPSGVLFGIGLLPLLAGIVWLRRRGRTVGA